MSSLPCSHPSFSGARGGGGGEDPTNKEPHTLVRAGRWSKQVGGGGKWGTGCGQCPIEWGDIRQSK